MTDGLVTAVVPTYGRSLDLLSEALGSVADQTYDDVEAVIVDDSDDLVSERVADRFADRLDVRVLRGSGEGVSAARNRGIREADGEFVAFLDDDDRWLPEKTARQVDAFERGGPDVGLVCVGQRGEDARGNVIGERRPTISGDVTERLLGRNQLAPTSSAMARTATVREHDCYFDEELSFREDDDWYIRLSRHCLVTSIPDLLVVRGTGSEDRLSTSTDSIPDDYYERFAGKHRSLAASYGPECERGFMAGLAESMAAVTLPAGEYARTRRYALRAIRYDPTSASAYMRFFAALGGRYTHGPLLRLRRTAHRLLS